jgi:hypothetical protein
MKRFLIVASIIAAFTLSTFSITAFAVDVGVSINLGQPNYYGPIDPNGYPQPQVIYRQPRAANQIPINQPPVYMRVPPNQAKNWRKHCGKYNACDERVLFVRDNWYNRQYAPRYQEQHGGNGERNNNNNNNNGNNNGGHGRNH